MTLRRNLDAVVVEDIVSGRGAAAVNPLAPRRGARAPSADAARRRLDELARVLGPLDVDHALSLGDRCVLVRALP